MDRREEEDLMGGREFQNAIAEGINEDCTTEVRKKGNKTFDGW